MNIYIYIEDIIAILHKYFHISIVIGFHIKKNEYVAR